MFVVNLSALFLEHLCREGLPWHLLQLSMPNGLHPSGRLTVVLSASVCDLLALRRDRGLWMYTGHAVQSPYRARERHDPGDSLAARPPVNGDGRSFQGHKSCIQVDASLERRTVGRILDAEA